MSSGFQLGMTFFLFRSGKVVPVTSRRELMRYTLVAHLPSRCLWFTLLPEYGLSAEG